jgi:HK97 family phage major capsid protein
MTPEFRATLDGLKAEIDLLIADEARWKEAHDIEKRSAAAVGAAQDNAAEKKEIRKVFHLGQAMDCVRRGVIEGEAREMNDEAIRRSKGGSGVSTDGINIPMDFFQVKRNIQKRDVQATGASTGTPYVPTQTMSFIDALRNDIVMMNMGATMLTGLTNNLTFPRKTAGAAVAASAENTTSTETTPTVDSVALSPKRITAFTDVSNQVSLQANEDILGITENDLYQATLQELQRQLIHGAGSGGEMTGLLGISGIGSIGTATVTYAVIQNIIDEVAKDNALMGNAGWLTNSFIRKLLKQKEEIASSGYKIWANDNTIDGFPVWMTNSVSRTLGTGTDASALIFSGNWSDFIIAQWGALNLTRNPYTKGKEALTEVIVHSWWDCDARHPESFAADVAITA